MILKKTKSGKASKGAIFLLLIILHIPSQVLSQSIKTIDLQNVPQRKVREYIVLRSYDEMEDFSAIHASWGKLTNEKDFNVIEETFYVKKELPVVWECYRNADPLEIWNGRSFRFALMICKCTESIIYGTSINVPDLDTGQIYFLNLRLIKGLVNVPVAFEITNIDNVNRIMEFSYIDNNKSLGKQTLLFSDMGNGKTRIVHLTYFKSKSWLRDELFYPYFHYKFIEEFHRNMRHLINKSKSPDKVL
jgi:hypothetical protein